MGWGVIVHLSNSSIEMKRPLNEFRKSNTKKKSPQFLALYRTFSRGARKIFLAFFFNLDKSVARLCLRLRTLGGTVKKKKYFEGRYVSHTHEQKKYCGFPQDKSTIQAFNRKPESDEMCLVHRQTQIHTWGHILCARITPLLVIKHTHHTLGWDVLLGTTPQLLFKMHTNERKKIVVETENVSQSEKKKYTVLWEGASAVHASLDAVYLT